MGVATLASELGGDSGATLTAREVAWLIDKEFAQTAKDLIWRRSKLGLRLTHAQIEKFQSRMQRRMSVTRTYQPVSRGQSLAPQGNPVTI